MSEYVFGMCGCAWVWDEFSEYLLETRVLTSQDFNTYPIQIFDILSSNHFMEQLSNFIHGNLKRKVIWIFYIGNR